MIAKPSDPSRDQAVLIVALFTVLVHAWQANDFAEADRTRNELKLLGVEVRFRKLRDGR